MQTQARDMVSILKEQELGCVPEPISRKGQGSVATRPFVHPALSHLNLRSFTVHRSPLPWTLILKSHSQESWGHHQVCVQVALRSPVAWPGRTRQPHTEGPHSLNTLLGLRWGGLAAASAPSRPSSDSSDNGALDSSHVQSVGRELPSHKVSGAWRLLLPYRSLPTSFQQ